MIATVYTSHMSTLLLCNFSLNSLTNTIKPVAKANFQLFSNDGLEYFCVLKNFNLGSELGEENCNKTLSLLSHQNAIE